MPSFIAALAISIAFFLFLFLFRLQTAFLLILSYLSPLKA